MDGFDSMLKFEDDSDDVVRSKEEDGIKAINFDMWGDCRVKTFKKALSENRKLKTLRLKLYSLIADFLDSIGVSHFVYAGTALAVWREEGTMISHDHDIDIAILEDDFLRIHSHLGKLAEEIPSVSACSMCPITRRAWVTPEGNDVPYDGIGAKRFKFYLNQSSWGEWDPQHGSRLASVHAPDPSLIHLDVFTFGQHPDREDCFCVNWTMTGAYDFRRKRFPKSVMFPLRDCVFEGMAVKAPNMLQDYLTLEYGYLGRDAMFDTESQLYVQIPHHLFTKLPDHVKKQISKE